MKCLNIKIIKQRIKEMEKIDKEGKLCGVGMLALAIFKAILKEKRK